MINISNCNFQNAEPELASLCRSIEKVSEAIHMIASKMTSGEVKAAINITAGNDRDPKWSYQSWDSWARNAALSQEEKSDSAFEADDDDYENL